MQCSHCARQPWISIGSRSARGAFRSLQRPGLRGDRSGAPASVALRPLSRGACRRARRRSLHDRNRAFARRRRGESRGRWHRRRRKPLRRLVAPVSLRDPLLAGRVDSGSRLGSRRFAPVHHRPSDRQPAAQPRRDRAQTCLGARRAEGGGDVELELHGRLADRHRRAANSARSAASVWSGSGLGCRSRGGSAQRCIPARTRRARDATASRAGARPRELGECVAHVRITRSGATCWSVHVDGSVA
jgi:hypothetical protein